MNLHTKTEFKDAIQAASEKLGLREVFIEKDYWVTLMLYRLSKSNHFNKVVFKGGTSLSKAYNMIKRFSEDVDLAILSNGLNGSQIKTLIEEVSKELSNLPFAEKNDPSITSKKGNIRRTLHEYPKSKTSLVYGIVREEVLLEINSFNEPTPFEALSITSYIHDFLKTNEQEDLISEYELEPFKINVLSKLITFIEKILSLSYASLEDVSQIGSQVQQRSRHFYDLSLLFKDDKIKNFLKDARAIEKLRQIRAEETVASRTRWVSIKLKDSPLFKDLKSSIKTIEGYYATELGQLLFKEDDLNDFKEVKDCLKSINEFLQNE